MTFIIIIRIINNYYTQEKNVESVHIHTQSYSMKLQLSCYSTDSTFTEQNKCTVYRTKQKTITRGALLAKISPYGLSNYRAEPTYKIPDPKTICPTKPCSSTVLTKKSKKKNHLPTELTPLWI